MAKGLKSFLSVRFNQHLVLLAALTAALSPSLVWGQAAATGSILGKVSDPSGAVMAGVSVTATSTALQVDHVAAVTDAAGNYELRDLPTPGVYRVTFERAGFQSMVREGLNLPSGFAARVDASLTVGAVTEAVTVSGYNPVVDTVDATRELTIPEQEIQTIPRGGGFQELYQLTPGLTVGGKPDVGDSNLGQRSTISTYGALLNMGVKFEGIDITSDSHDFSTVMYISSYNLNEVQTKSTGNTADVAQPGFSMDSIMKSGSNQTHGTILGEYQPGQFQGNNVTPDLAAQGITQTNPLQYYNTVAGDLGGHIVRNKLWYYGAYSRQAMVTGQIGVVSGPNANGCWTCTDAPAAMLPSVITQYSAKGNYQPKDNLRFIGTWTRGVKYIQGLGASLTSPLPSSASQNQTTTIFKGEIQWTVTPRLVVNVLSGNALSNTHFFSSSPAVKGFPSSVEQSTGLLTGPATNYTQSTPSFKIPLNANSVYARGKHTVKLGTEMILDNGRDTWQGERNPGPGDYRLMFNLGKPFQVQIYNYPVTPSNRFNSQALYAMDNWKIKRVTLNYGVRWDRYHSYYPDQNKAAGQFSAAATYPGRDILTWKDILPRIGAAWDVFGKGRTVIKGSFGIFGDNMMAGYAGSFNPNSTLTTTYKWSGPCVSTGFNNVSYTQPNTSCDIDPTYIAGLSPSSSQYVSQTGGSNLLLNTALTQPKIYNYTVRIEHELVSNVSVSAGWVHYTNKNTLWPAVGGALGGSGSTPTIFPNRPSSAYSVVVPVTDPTTGNTVNFYTYPSTYKGQTFDQTQQINAPDNRPDHYDSFEFTATKRYSNKWTGLASFWTTKDDRWLIPVASNPNAAYFPQDQTRSWEARASGMYHLPWAFDLTGLFRATSGIKGQRTLRSSSAALLQGTVTVPVEAYGTQSGPVVSVGNLKLARTTRFGERWSLQTSAEVFNGFNGSAATGYSWLTGTTYGRVTQIINPRVVRVSAQIKF